ncbi:GNAT family N-acetyltransferase [Rhodanobacter glycinis]|uniref:GNAT family N-acetyltransferase n=2 Tax=Rhodanobacter glycinis TaxID=582702 RepID=A0A502C9K8_9GAMM|nr:GNAT family N-acetyltransferase [Rhodanobacter glycinis]TPG46861.1 GNAT family N-acetyltransferase [Rhodanobacter glycinis]
MMRDHNNRATLRSPVETNMHEHPTLCVIQVDAKLHPSLLGLRVLPVQRDWVGAIADLLADVALCPGNEPMAILKGDTPIGYYCIEPTARSVAGRDFELPSLGLRGFFIDATWQGRGLGKQALQAMLVDLARRHPDARQLALTVNCNNHAALQLYLRTGFHDSGELYHGGRSGPRHLLLRPLP